MKKRILFLCVAIGWTIGTNASETQQPLTVKTTGRAIAGALKVATARTGSLEAFGDGIRRWALSAADREIGEGKATAGPLKLEFSVTILSVESTAPAVSLPPDSPEEIDVCYQICPTSQQSFLQCYIDCSAPKRK
jgi:hypothetical protein